ncbi:hypothetical protein JWG45_01625 [Leptospira sp. 201903070]|uniref:Lipoprotein n=1 Tax=Leptospira ainlahdjerensis TaxID=2810033 RepID=A0ABS2U647_9LEPT|nr:hypothetical protein [Leptospira ainlahdjerensis]MBM9575841.1 hypothetical protein [Leptospira ainlahdjerensis]
MKISYKLSFTFIALLSTVNCIKVASSEIVKTPKGFYRFYETAADRYNSKVEFCSVDQKTNAITCKNVTVNLGF